MGMGMCEEGLKKLADSIEVITGGHTLPVPVCLFPTMPGTECNAAALYLVHLQGELSKVARLVGVEDVSLVLPKGWSGEEILGVVEGWLQLRSRHLMHVRLSSDVALEFMRAVQYMMEARFLIKCGKVSV